MTADLAALKQFSLEGARAIIWVFKKSTRAGTPPTYVFTGRWIPSDEALSSALVESFDSARNRIEEEMEYGILEQNNEASVLTLDSIETHADSIILGISEELEGKKAKKTKELSNSDFYVIKIISEVGAVYCFKRCDASWNAKKSGILFQAIFQDDMLTLDVTPKFNISKYFDFFVFNGKIFAENKKNFESILSYKQAHADDFTELQAEAEFDSIFAEMGPITTYVGNNAMQLRRVSAIKQKGHYKNPEFLNSLRTNYQAYGLNIQYDNNGKIIPTAET